MSKKMINWLVIAAVLAVPAVALAQEGEVVPEGLGELVSTLIGAAQGGQWSVFVSLLIMVLVFFVQKVPFISNLLPKAVKPWVAAVAGVLSAVATAAFTTGDWLQAILGGLVTGAAASGLWELVGKHLMKKSEPVEDPAAPVEEPSDAV